jgi:hypothetical protein
MALGLIDLVNDAEQFGQFDDDAEFFVYFAGGRVGEGLEGMAITPESLRAFAMAARKKLRNGDGSFARDHVRAVGQRVEVVGKTEVRICGSRSELLRTLTAASGVEAAVLGVRAFEPKWRVTADEDGQHCFAAAL